MSEVRINVFVTMDSADLARFDGDADLENAIKARLFEIDVADGGVVIPNVLGIDVEVDD